jgi:hypothetical protein
MNRTRQEKRAFALLAAIALSVSALSSGSVLADDTPGPCAALKRIVAAAPDRFTSLQSGDGRNVAQPYGDDARCSTEGASYQCVWTPHSEAGPTADALQAVAADIASCLPEATHDQNSPARQHFYVGARGSRTEITAITAGAGKLKLVVSAK